MFYKLDTSGHLCAYSFDTEFSDGNTYRGEIPADFCEDNFSAWRIEGGRLVFDEYYDEAARQREADAAELAELLQWFSQYDQQVMQYQRAGRLGQAYDRDMASLDRQAVEKQKRIRELRGIIKQ